MQNFRIYIIILISFFSSFSFSQTLEETYRFAETQLQQGNDDIALTAFKRVIYFDKEYIFSNSYNYIAEIFYKKKEFKNAAEFFDQYFSIAKTDSEKYNALFAEVRCSLQLKNYNNSLYELNNLPKVSDERLLKRKNYYYGLCYYALTMFDSAEKYFLFCINDSDKKNISEIKYYILKAVKAGKPSPETLRTLSYILPGIGQLLSADYKNATNSFLLNALLIGAFIYTYQAYDLLNATLSVFPWFQRYYTGGAMHTINIAEKHIAEKRAKYFNAINNLILQSNSN